jgi:hypothetical protein
MKRFGTIDALCNILEAAYREGPGEPGRNAFMKVLQSHLDFQQTQAYKYAWTVLHDNSELSSEHVRANFARLVGTWRTSSGKTLADVGYGGNAMSTRVETWTFYDDLAYSHSIESITSAYSPWGSWSRPWSKEEDGQWVPPDRIGSVINILVFPFGQNENREVRIDWGSCKDARPMECRIDFSEFRRA